MKWWEIVLMIAAVIYAGAIVGVHAALIFGLKVELVAHRDGRRCDCYKTSGRGPAQ